MGDTSRVTRFEIINHTPCSECLGECVLGSFGNTVICPQCDGRGVPGRIVIANGDEFKFTVQLQDDGKTLKIFIHERHADNI